MTTPEDRLRADYVEGRIEIDEFEERLGALLAGRPMAADRRGGNVAAILKEAWTDRPGAILPYNPIQSKAGVDMAINYQRMLEIKKRHHANESQTNPENPSPEAK